MAGLFDINLAGLGDLLKGGGDLAVKIRQAITGQDPEGDLKKLQAELDAAQASDAAQGAVNLEEAKSSSLFVSGWRPAVGWACTIGLVWDVLVHPMAAWACAVWAPSITVPTIDTSVIVPMLMGLLGLGTMRTVEKIKGVASK